MRHTKKSSAAVGMLSWTFFSSLLLCILFVSLDDSQETFFFLLVHSLPMRLDTHEKKKKHSLRASVKRWRRRLLSRFSSQLPGTRHFQPNIRLYRAMDPRKHSTHTRNSQFYREKLFPPRLFCSEKKVFCVQWEKWATGKSPQDEASEARL